MRSMIGFAVLVAVIGFSGCQSTNGPARGLLVDGCGANRRAARAANRACQGTIIEAGDCGCGGEVYSDPGMMQYGPAGGGDCGCGGDSVTSMSAPYDCGDSGCGCGYGGGAPVVAPMEFSAPAPAGGGCSTCEAASLRGRRGQRGLFNGAGSGNGLGLGKNDRGLACEDLGSGGCSECAARKTARSLRPRKSRGGDQFGIAGTDDTIVSVEEYDLVSDEYIVGGGEYAGRISGRRISHGVISDFREARGRLSGSAAGCGRGGCGHSGRLCGLCTKVRGAAGLGSGNPYGGAIPHTAQQPGQSGIAPSYAYPYYTTRGPRDFLRDNPPSIGR